VRAIRFVVKKRWKFRNPNRYLHRIDVILISIFDKKLNGEGEPLLGRELSI
jgi:hypothetical protein